VSPLTQLGSLKRANAHYRVAGVHLKTDKREKQDNVSKIIKWILCIINSEN
jgi:hypothetical protein